MYNCASSATWRDAKIKEWKTDVQLIVKRMRLHFQVINF